MTRVNSLWTPFNTSISFRWYILQFSVCYRQTANLLDLEIKISEDYMPKCSRAVSKKSRRPLQRILTPLLVTSGSRRDIMWGWSTKIDWRGSFPRVNGRKFFSSLIKLHWSWNSTEVSNHCSNWLGISISNLCFTMLSLTVLQTSSCLWSPFQTSSGLYSLRPLRASFDQPKLARSLVRHG